MNLDPTRRLLDALTRVVRPPTLDEAHPQDAQPAQVVHSDAGGRGQTCKVKNCNFQTNSGLEIFQGLEEKSSYFSFSLLQRSRGSPWKILLASINQHAAQAATTRSGVVVCDF